MPENLLGVFSSDNNDPLQHRYDHTAVNSYNPVERSNTRIVFQRRTIVGTNEPTYLGGLCSGDGSIVYWTNDTKPLP